MPEPEKKNPEEESGERKRQTNYLNLGRGETAIERTPSTGTKHLDAEWRAVMKIGAEILPLPNIKEILVGRAPDPDPAVGLDLTKHGGLPLGVSRHHARISVVDGLLYLRDLASTNGTRINGFQVTPNQDYRLRDGDEIELGRLRMYLKFERINNPNK